MNVLIVCVTITCALIGYLIGRADARDAQARLRVQTLERALTDLAEAILRYGLRADPEPVAPGEIDTFENVMAALQRAREVVRKRETP